MFSRQCALSNYSGVQVNKSRDTTEDESCFPALRRPYSWCSFWCKFIIQSFPHTPLPQHSQACPSTHIPCRRPAPQAIMPPSPRWSNSCTDKFICVPIVEGKGQIASADNDKQPNNNKDLHSWSSNDEVAGSCFPHVGTLRVPAVCVVNTHQCVVNTHQYTCTGRICQNIDAGFGRQPQYKDRGGEPRQWRALRAMQRASSNLRQLGTRQVVHAQLAVKKTWTNLEVTTIARCAWRRASPGGGYTARAGSE